MIEVALSNETGSVGNFPTLHLMTEIDPRFETQFEKSQNNNSVQKNIYTYWPCNWSDGCESLTEVTLL